jgi:hypothetical protein
MKWYNTIQYTDKLIEISINYFMQPANVCPLDDKKVTADWRITLYNLQSCIIYRGL